MARKRKVGQKTPSYGMAADQRRSSGKRIERYEDTLEEGGVDDFMFKRDHIMFNPQDEESDGDIADVGEEVMAIPKRQRPVAQVDEDQDEDENVPEEQPRKRRKEKSKPETSAKGRFGKPIPDSDDEDESGASGSGSGSDLEDEGWGRQYYSMPSSRREKEKEGEYNEQREEERELEEREVRRLQRKAREALRGEDYGLEDDDLEIDQIPVQEEITVKVALPDTSDPAVLLRHMEVYEPVKLALAREWPLVVRKLEKTQKGIRKMEAEEEGQLHRGLGWLHYLERPDLSSHPILTRLLELKKGVSDLEDLDFDAASVSGDALVPTGWASDEDDEVDADEEEAELRELIKAKKELIARMMRGDAVNGEEDADDEEWRREGLEDGELADLLADADASAGGDTSRPMKKVKVKGKKSKEQKAAKSKKLATPATIPVYPTLSEPAFFTSSQSSAPRHAIEADDLGDPTALLDADAEDKDRRKRSLAFHTSKIASTANRRAAAREKRMGGDEDIPYRDRQAARDAALRKQSRSVAGAGGEDLDGREMTAKERKAARDVRDELGEDLGGGEEDGEGYYDLIARSKSAAKASKVAAHEATMADRMESLRELDKEGEAGPRSLTRAIEKNKGLTPRRNKAGRNPRVKKRLAYEKAKQKVGSQRAVYKGGQGAQGGGYKGERTGISTVVKSRRF